MMNIEKLQKECRRNSTETPGSEFDAVKNLLDITKPIIGTGNKIILGEDGFKQSQEGKTEQENLEKNTNVDDEEEDGQTTKD